MFCNNCRQYTTHALLYTHKEDFFNYIGPVDQDGEDFTLSSLWICCGCERLTLMEVTYDENDKEIGTELYPIREKHHLSVNPSCS